MLKLIFTEMSSLHSQHYSAKVWNQLDKVIFFIQQGCIKLIKLILVKTLIMLQKILFQIKAFLKNFLFNKE